MFVWCGRSSALNCGCLRWWLCSVLSFCPSDGCEGQSLLAVSQSGLSLSLASLFSGISRRESTCAALLWEEAGGTVPNWKQKLLFCGSIKKLKLKMNHGCVHSVFPKTKCLKPLESLGFPLNESSLNTLNQMCLIPFLFACKSFSVSRQTSCLLKRVEVCAWLFVMLLVARTLQGFGGAGRCLLERS